MDENRTEGNVTEVSGEIELSEAWKWFLIVILVILIIMGTLGNLLTMYVIAKHKELQTVTNAFIFNLAITDLLVSLFVDGFNVVGIADTGFFFRQHAVCEFHWTLRILDTSTEQDYFLRGVKVSIYIRAHHPSLNRDGGRHSLPDSVDPVFTSHFREAHWFVGSVCVTSCICSIMTMMIIAVNRYYYVTDKPRHDELFTTCRLIVIIIVLWLYSFSLFDLPLYDYKTMGCTYDRTADFSFTLHLICVGIVIPVVVVIVCYTRIYLFVRASNKRMVKHRQQNNMTPADKLKVDDLTLLRTLVIIGVVFFICWSQYVIVVLADFEDHWPMGVHMTALVTAHSSSSTNCIILGVTNPKFREKYLLVLKPKGCASTTPPASRDQTTLPRSRNSASAKVEQDSTTLDKGTQENV
ncbi:melatonin receptor [Branchiostoma belcheri]|nr:melatonin receptor [Branchiostoma belcheri]